MERNLETYVQGSNERLVVDVNIYNAGEDAFGSEFLLHLPPTLSFINTDRNSSNFDILCWPPGEDSGPVLRCDIGNPLEQRQTAALRVLLQPVPDVTKPDRVISFHLQVSSIYKEEAAKAADNQKNLTLDLRVDTDLIIDG